MSKVQTIYVLALTVKTFIFNDGEARTLARTMQSYMDIGYKLMSAACIGNYVLAGTLQVFYII